MSNQLTKMDSARKRNRASDSLIGAVLNGGPIAWISCLIMGFGNFAAGQFIKGIMFLAIEVAFLYIMLSPGGGLYCISMLPSLGDTPDQEVYDEWQMIYVTVMGDRSHLILLYGVVFVFITIAFLVIWRASVRSGYQARCRKVSGAKVPSFVEDIKALFDENIHKLLMTPPFVALIVFTIVPLAYMICMAFTNYSESGGHLNLFDWVGFETFALLFESGGTISKQFWSVLSWTITWAIFATFLNFFLGTFLAIIINRPTTRVKGFWRTMLSFTIAVPQFISLLIINKMFDDYGIINGMLTSMGHDKIRFLSIATNARIFVIVANLWVGIPYTVMQVTGILKNIPSDLYEAARIDGANVAQQFINITLPYMIFVMTPYLITSFTGNINNFNVIFLLTGGGPMTLEGTAGQTDLLVTWLYRLSVEKQEYNLAAVIGIFTFVVLAIVSLVTYRSSGSYKDEEGFK